MARQGSLQWYKERLEAVEGLKHKQDGVIQEQAARITALEQMVGDKYPDYPADRNAPGAWHKEEQADIAFRNRMIALREWLARNYKEAEYGAGIVLTNLLGLNGDPAILAAAHACLQANWTPEGSILLNLYNLSIERWKEDTEGMKRATLKCYYAELESSVKKLVANYRFEDDHAETVERIEELAQANAEVEAEESDAPDGLAIAEALVMAEEPSAPSPAVDVLAQEWVANAPTDDEAVERANRAREIWVQCEAFYGKDDQLTRMAWNKYMGVVLES
jgi:hypothetical protein